MSSLNPAKPETVGQRDGCRSRRSSSASPPIAINIRTRDDENRARCNHPSSTLSHPAGSGEFDSGPRVT